MKAIIIATVIFCLAGSLSAADSFRVDAVDRKSPNIKLIGIGKIKLEEINIFINGAACRASIDEVKKAYQKRIERMGAEMGIEDKVDLEKMPVDLGIRVLVSFSFKENRQQQGNHLIDDVPNFRFKKIIDVRMADDLEDIFSEKEVELFQVFEKEGDLGLPVESVIYIVRP